MIHARSRVWRGNSHGFRGLAGQWWIPVPLPPPARSRPTPLACETAEIPNKHGASCTNLRTAIQLPKPRISSGHLEKSVSNRRLIACDENGVTFSYKDYRVEGGARYKIMTLAPHEFIRRFLSHVLPHGFHRIRPVRPDKPGFIGFCRAGQELMAALPLKNCTSAPSLCLGGASWRRSKVRFSRPPAPLRIRRLAVLLHLRMLPPHRRAEALVHGEELEPGPQSLASVSYSSARLGMSVRVMVAIWGWTRQPSQPSVSAPQRNAPVVARGEVRLLSEYDSRGGHPHANQFTRAPAPGPRRRGLPATVAAGHRGVRVRIHVGSRACAHTRSAAPPHRRSARRRVTRRRAVGGRRPWCLPAGRRRGPARPGARRRGGAQSDRPGAAAVLRPADPDTRLAVGALFGPKQNRALSSRDPSRVFRSTVSTVSHQCLHHPCCS